MTGELGDLPGGETGEDARGELTALRLQPRDLVLNVDLGLRGHVPQLLDLRFELGDRLFEIEECDGHGRERSLTYNPTELRSPDRAVPAGRQRRRCRRGPPGRRTAPAPHRGRAAPRAARAARGSRAPTTARRG